MKTPCLSALVALLAAASAGAQDTPVTIRAGRLLDGVGGVADNVTITIEGSRITRVGPVTGAVTYDLQASDRGVELAAALRP